MLRIFLFLAVAVLWLNVQADDNEVKKVAKILITNGTNSTNGPDEAFCSKVIDGMQELQLRRSKFSRMSKKDDDEMKNHMANLRKVIGPRGNDTDDVAEAHPDLSNIALEGDMIMNPEQINYMVTGTGWFNHKLTTALFNGQDDKSKRSVSTDPNVYWTVGTPVPYEIDYSLSNIRSQILKGIKYWTDNSCLTFVENPRAYNRLRFFYGTGCFSYVGKQKKWEKQDISIGKGCDSLGTICHEMAHAMGFYHTQSRYDRDSYLYINYGNIQGSLQYNFDKQSPRTETHFGMTYDYGSVMQYPPYAFAVNPNQPTSAARDPNQQNMMGQREAPAFSDVKQMNILYKCADRCRNSMYCANGGIINSKTCSSCICPKYFAGHTCSSLARGTAPVCNGRVIQSACELCFKVDVSSITAIRFWGSEKLCYLLYICIADASSSAFESFTATVGIGMTYAYAASANDCYWMIQAPTGRRIQLQVKSLDTNCMEGCNWSGFEINMGDLEMTGMLVCCSSISRSSYTSKSNVIVIRGTSRYNNANMGISYRVV